MAAEDEDVDELLRLIATAEEKVATQYTSVKTVLITDMKSFSPMTEEYGSALTAKAVQRHRDLLLPAIQRHGGQGKPAGGDGLIAAFDDAATAVAAAIEMQQVLAEHNRNHPYERDMTVRIGIAYGEVVLDRGGRPFIGNALNVAARIMNLADGGQAFTTATVVGRAGLRSHPLARAVRAEEHRQAGRGHRGALVRRPGARDPRTRTLAEPGASRSHDNEKARRMPGPVRSLELATGLEPATY